MRLAVNGRFLTARPTGVQRVARELVREMIRQLREPECLTLFVPRGHEPSPELRGARIPVTGRLGGIPWEQLELPARTLRGYDVSLDPANAGPVWGGRRVLVLHDVLPLTHPDGYSPAFREWFRRVVVTAARRARRVVTFSEWSKEQAVRAIGLRPERVVVAIQGTRPFRDPAATGAVRAVLDRLGVASGYVLATGLGDPRKNVEFLADVMEVLRRRPGPGPLLVLTGAGYRHVHPPVEATRHPDVRRLGHVTDADLRALYTGAGAFCFPSLAEGFGRPPLEAMACGAPVITAPYGSAREVLGDAASIVPLEPGAWADAIEEALTDGPGRRRRVARGRAHAARFRWEDTARQVFEACRAAAAEGAGPHESATPSGSD